MRRRHFLMSTGVATAGVGTLGAAAGQQAPGLTAGRPEIRITDIKTFLVGLGRNHLFVKVETDQGIHGIGEAYSCGPDQATVAAIHDFKDWLVGQDPRNIEHLWAMMYNFSRFPGGSVLNAAISGIEHALWDIAGKAAGLPVYRLLGGKCRDKVRVYQGVGGAEPQQLAESARAAVEKYGYTAVKMSPHPPGMHAAALQRGHPCGRAADPRGPRRPRARTSTSPSISTPSSSSRAGPCAWPGRSSPISRSGSRSRSGPRTSSAMAKLAAHVSVPLASGECNYTKFEFQPILQAQALDIIQPDICLCGGVLEMKKIAAMAEAHYVMVAPHNPMGPVANVVNTHFAASTPNFLILEYTPDDAPPRRDLVRRNPWSSKDGYLPIPEKPGWGIELNEEAFRHYPPRPWRRGFGYRADGSVDFI